MGTNTNIWTTSGPKGFWSRPRPCVYRSATKGKNGITELYRFRITTQHKNTKKNNCHTFASVCGIKEIPWIAFVCQINRLPGVPRTRLAPCCRKCIDCRPCSIPHIKRLEIYSARPSRRCARCARKPTQPRARARACVHNLLLISNVTKYY